MKKRLGFISNSSSSSFVLAYKDGELKSLLSEAFDIDEKHPLKNIIECAKNTILDCIEEDNLSQKDIIEYYNDDDENELNSEQKMMIGWLKDGYTICSGSFTDDNGDDMESTLCNTEINYDTEKLKLYCEGCY